MRTDHVRRRNGNRFICQIESVNGWCGGRGLPAVRFHVLQHVRDVWPRGRRRASRGRRRCCQPSGRQVQEKLVPDVVAPLPKGYFYTYYTILLYALEILSQIIMLNLQNNLIFVLD